MGLRVLNERKKKPCGGMKMRKKNASGQEILYIQKWANDFVFAFARCHLANGRQYGSIVLCIVYAMTPCVCVAKRKREKGGPTAAATTTKKDHRKEYKKEIQFLMDFDLPAHCTECRVCSCSLFSSFLYFIF